MYQRLFSQGTYLRLKAADLPSTSQELPRIKKLSEEFLKAAEIVHDSHPDKVDVKAAREALAALTTDNIGRLRPGYSDFCNTLRGLGCLKCHAKDADVPEDKDPSIFGAYTLDMNDYFCTSNVKALLSVVNLSDLDKSKLLLKATAAVDHEGAEDLKLTAAQGEELRAALGKWIYSGGEGHAALGSAAAEKYATTVAYTPVTARDDQSEISPKAYRSPWGIAVSPDGQTVYVSDASAGCVEVLSASGGAKGPGIPLHGRPMGLCLSSDGDTLYVAERGAGTVAMIDTDKWIVTGRIPVGRWPVAVTLAPTSKRLVVCNQDSHTLSVLDASQSPPRPIKDVKVVREPSSVAVTPDERFIAVANQLPLGPSTDAALAADVSIIDAERLTVQATIKLPPGSAPVNGICTSPDNQWAYVVHGLGHFNLPMTQLERGWVNTYALTIIDIYQARRLATLLLDDLTQGAADPFAVVCSRDGRRLWISHTGVHEISTVEIARVHELLNGNVSGDLAQLMDGSLPNIWVRIQKDRSLIDELSYDLTALYIADAIHKSPSGGYGPRGIALTPDGRTLLVANYFSGSIAALDANSGKLLGTIWQGPQREPDSIRRGELLFHDATQSFQRWHSC
ncbi:MAG: beta-propeller fold lactonase family protein, partial [Planctomycetes bacterium]|nr:beta-propeller fold lactonase family protein [Planctomycetota bacterium]